MAAEESEDILTHQAGIEREFVDILARAVAREEFKDILTCWWPERVRGNSHVGDG